MQRSKRINYKEEFDRKKFCIVRSILGKGKVELINKKIKEQLKKQEFVDGNNPYITNIKRKAYNMYSMLIMEHTLKTDAPKDYIAKKELVLEEVYGEIISKIEEDLSKIFYLIRINYWRVIGMTYMEIYKDSPEQEVHQDSPEGMNRIFITIPLEKTDILMGPTIFYNEEKVGKYRVNQESEGGGKEGNIGYIKEMDKEKRGDFEKARTQSELEEGDITIHRDMTYHSGGENKTSKTRKFLFLVCDYTEKID